MEIKENTIYNCDCLELMQEMERQGIKADWVITDPPYGIGAVEHRTDKNGIIMGHGNHKAQCRTYKKADWDDAKIDKEYFYLMKLISNQQIIFGGNYYTDILPPTKSWIVWDKRLDNNLRLDFADCELAWCSQGLARVFRYLYTGYLQGDIKNRDYRFHPTQKPTQLWIMLLNYYTKEGDLILDPFAGSCSLAVACHKTGRKYICCEKDKEYYDKGVAWLEKVKSQISFFD